MTVAALHYLPLNMNTRVPVPIEDVARDAGWQIGRESHNSPKAVCSGFTVNLDGRKIIGINRRISPRRQRYAIAHQLGHGLAHISRSRPLIVCYSLRLELPSTSSKTIANSTEEDEARSFAFEVLMPDGPLRDALVREHSQATSRDQLIERLAQIFEVSNEAMGFRLIMLGWVSA